MVTMEFKLEQFEGPLDLLLSLIEKNELDIYDIPIAELTDQYMHVINQADMEGMSEFIIMAATLLEIKSRMLLPKPPDTSEEGEDPRELLIKKLIAYKECKQLAEYLNALPGQGERVTRDASWTLFPRYETIDTDEIMEGTTLIDLWSVFRDVIKRRQLKIDPIRAGYGNMARERFTVEEKTIFVLSQLERKKSVDLRELLESCGSLREIIVTFLALLELIHKNLLTATQQDTFGEVRVELKS